MKTTTMTRLARMLLAAALLTTLPVHAKNGATATEVPGEILVQLRTSGAIQPLLNRYGLSVVSQFGTRPIYRLKVVGNADTRDRIASLEAEPDVLLAEVNAIQQSPESKKNGAWSIGDPSAYVAQWAPQAMRLADAQRLSTGAGVRVAVLDSGVDRSHPALAGRLLPGFDFVDFDNDPSEVGNRVNNPSFGHGTHVAGLVALVAPDARILPLRVLDANGQGSAWAIAQAILYAIDPDGNPATDDGAKVINLSLGTGTRTRIVDTIEKLASCGAADAAVADTSDAGYADDRSRCARFGGALLIAAAGNDGSSSVKEYPAAEGAHGLIAVTASTAASRLAPFGNSGSWVMVAAPGDGITSTVPGGGFGTWSGTSMAAPLLAGTAALLRSARPDLSTDDAVRRLTRVGGNLCGSPLRVVDAYAVLTNTVPAERSCR